MSKFAVYFVPEQDDPFYRLGTQILGSDVRTRSFREMSLDLRSHFVRESFNDSWVAFSRPFGFHLTIGDAMESETSSIQQVENRLAHF